LYIIPTIPTLIYRRSRGVHGQGGIAYETLIIYIGFFVKNKGVILGLPIQ